MLKRIKPETYTLIGILVLFVVGSLFHFLYSLTGECFIVGLFVPINESIFESRFQYTAELNKMGAKIIDQGKSAIFEGVKELYGSSVEATDLRAGAALIIAGIVANGETKLSNLNHIDRGYENIEEKFRKIGANIVRITEED